MRRSVALPATTLLILLALPGASAQDGSEPTGRHYAQLTAEEIDGASGGVDFGADRIRTRLEARRGPVTGEFMPDFGVERPDVPPGRGGAVDARPGGCWAEVLSATPAERRSAAAPIDPYASIELTWAATIRQPSANRTHVCMVLPILPPAAWLRAATVAKSVP